MLESSAKLESACRDFEEDLVLYYYGEGSAAERNRVEDHIKSCLRCVRFLADLRKLLPQMARPKEMPPSFWDNYYREIIGKLALQQERSAWWRNLFAPMRVWIVPAFGTVAVTVLAFALVLGKGGWSFQSSHSQQKIPQEILTDSKQLEFFSSMDMLESLHLLEALDGTKQESMPGQSG
jgi:predicted anti-sigma-YlaC factor YlaD